MSNILDGLIEHILNPLILLIFSLGLLVFLWGVAEFLRSGSNPTKNNEGKDHMLWGVIGMLIMISAYTIITLITNTFGIDPTRLPSSNSGNSNLQGVGSGNSQQLPRTDN